MSSMDFPLNYLKFFFEYPGQSDQSQNRIHNQIRQKYLAHDLIILSLYRRDNIPTIRLECWSMAASLYDGEKASGPTPVMFASEPEVAYDAVESDLAKIHHDIMRINKSFLIFEHINLKAAAGVIKKPR